MHTHIHILTQCMHTNFYITTHTAFSLSLQIRWTQISFKLIMTLMIQQVKLLYQHSDVLTVTITDKRQRVLSNAQDKKQFVSSMSLREKEPHESLRELRSQSNVAISTRPPITQRKPRNLSSTDGNVAFNK